MGSPRAGRGRLGGRGGAGGEVLRLSQTRRQGRLGHLPQGGFSDWRHPFGWGPPAKWPPRRERRGEAEAEVGKVEEVEEVKLEEEVEEVVICKLERAVEAAEGRAATAGGGGERPGVKAGARGGRGRAFPESGQRRRRGGPRRRSSVFGLYYTLKPIPSSYTPSLSLLPPPRRRSALHPRSTTRPR